MNWNIDKLLLAAVLILISINTYSQSKEDGINLYVKKAVKTRSALVKGDAYNKILVEKSFEESEIPCSFEMIRRALFDDEISIDIYVLHGKDGELTYVAFILRNNYKAPHILTLFGEDQLNAIILKIGSINS